MYWYLILSGYRDNTNPGTDMEVLSIFFFFNVVSKEGGWIEVQERLTQEDLLACQQ